MSCRRSVSEALGKSWVNGTYVVDDHGHGGNINTTSEHVGGDENLCMAGAELVDDLVTL